jgi:ferrous iron transport protein B
VSANKKCGDLASKLSEIRRVAFVGNPNAGKTTLFNAITGSDQKVANYPGVTVERVSANKQLGNFKVEFIDVPGLYSLEPVSEDEAVAVSVVLGKEEPVDLIVCVLDGSNLERNLYLYSQIADLGTPIIVALNMVDRVQSAGNQIDAKLLAAELGHSVITVTGHRDVGISELNKGIETALLDPKPRVPNEQPKTLEGRYVWSRTIQNLVISSISAPSKKSKLTDKVDLVLTHRVFGLAIFVGVMYLVFQSIYTFSAPIMTAIESTFSFLGSKISPALSGSPILQSLVVDGLIAGIGSVLVFLPQILILFFFIAMLEGSGYLARAAFLMDRLLGWCGLNGRAFIPLLSSFACAIPGIMAARVMPDPKSRLATIMVAPLMSCSARLPVYMLLIGAFIEPKLGPFWAGFTLFAMHLLGLLVAIPVVLVLSRGVLKSSKLPFLLELPPYQMPKWKDVFLAMLTRGKIFVTTAGTTILVMSILIWAAGYFPRSPVDAKLSAGKQAEIQLANSALGRFGKTIEPVFIPAGFDWRISTAILSAFPAREVVVPSMGIVFSLGADVDEESLDLKGALTNAKWPDGRPLMTAWTAVGLMVFFALCAQCLSTLATVRRETNSRKWPFIMFVYMTTLAYLGAVFIHWLSKVVG